MENTGAAVIPSLYALIAWSQAGHGPGGQESALYTGRRVPGELHGLPG